MSRRSAAWWRAPDIPAKTGFELYCHGDAAERLWDALMAAGAPNGLVAGRTWARVTPCAWKRLIRCTAMSSTIATTPLGGGLGVGDQVGQTVVFRPRAVARAKAAGRYAQVGRARTAANRASRAAVTLVQRRRQVIGRVTSGTKSPSLGKGDRLGYVASGEARLGNRVDVEIRGRKVRGRRWFHCRFTAVNGAAIRIMKEVSDGVS